MTVHGRRERPTAVHPSASGSTGSVRASASATARASAATDARGPSRVTENELWAALAPAHEEARPCACGGIVVADPDWPLASVIEHQATERHQLWRAWWLSSW